MAAEGLRNGKGVYLEGESKKKYEGEFQDDEFHGKGKLQGPGFQYTGHFLNGDYDGEGELTTEHFVFVGHFHKGVIDGDGLIKYHNG